MLKACERSRREEQYLGLSDEEKRAINAAVEHLASSIKADDHQAVRDAIEQLNEKTMGLAELIMTAAIGKALKNKRVREIQ